MNHYRYKLHGHEDFRPLPEAFPEDIRIEISFVKFESPNDEALFEDAFRLKAISPSVGIICESLIYGHSLRDYPNISERLEAVSKYLKRHLIDRLWYEKPEKYRSLGAYEINKDLHHRIGVNIL